MPLLFVSLHDLVLVFVAGVAVGVIGSTMFHGWMEVRRWFPRKAK